MNFIEQTNYNTEINSCDTYVLFYSNMLVSHSNHSIKASIGTKRSISTSEQILQTVGPQFNEISCDPTEAEVELYSMERTGNDFR